MDPVPSQPIQKEPAISIMLSVAIAIMALMIGTAILSLFVRTNSIRVHDQTYDGWFRIDKLTMVRGGFVTVRGLRAQVLYNFPQYIAPGSYTDLYIPKSALEDHVITKGDYVVFEVYEDTGGKTNFTGYPNFEAATIIPLRTVFGQPVRKTVRLL